MVNQKNERSSCIDAYVQSDQQFRMVKSPRDLSVCLESHMVNRPQN